MPVCHSQCSSFPSLAVSNPPSTSQLTIRHHLYCIHSTTLDRADLCDCQCLLVGRFRLDRLPRHLCAWTIWSVQLAGPSSRGGGRSVEIYFLYQIARPGFVAHWARPPRASVRDLLDLFPMPEGLLSSSAAAIALEGNSNQASIRHQYGRLSLCIIKCGCSSSASDQQRRRIE